MKKLGGGGGDCCGKVETVAAVACLSSSCRWLPAAVLCTYSSSQVRLFLLLLCKFISINFETLLQKQYLVLTVVYENKN